MAEKCNLINVCVRAALLSTSFMLFTGCNVLAGEGTLIIKAFHKGKHGCCILIHGPVGSDSVINAECSQQECCGECDSELVSSLSDFMFRSLTHFTL